MSEQYYQDGIYGYVPDLATAIAFISVFAISTLLHTYQIFVRKPRIMVWMVVFPICGLLEIIGWGGRVWSHYNVIGAGYIMQNVCLIIAPTFMSAGLYMLLSTLIDKISAQNSYMSGKWLKISFMGADVISLVVQAVGGGMASSATKPAQVTLGGQIMLGGITFQLFVMLVFAIYGALWLRKSRSAVSDVIHELPGGAGVGKTIWAIIICSTMIILRGFWRSVELGDGFDCELAQNESLFLLDAIPVAIAMYIVNAIHPNHHLVDLVTSSDGRSIGTFPEKDVNVFSMSAEARAERGESIGEKPSHEGS